MNNDLMWGTGNDVTSTPPEFFAIINAQAGGFGCDVAALSTNRKVENYFGPDHIEPWRRDCLKIDWPDDKPNWLNPPYSDPEFACKPLGKCKKKLCMKRGGCDYTYRPGCVDFIRKAAEQRDMGVETWLLLASRTDNQWFHEFIWDRTESQWQHGVRGNFLKGRLKFEGHKDSAPFPSLLVRFIPDRLLKYDGD